MPRRGGLARIRQVVSSAAGSSVNPTAVERAQCQFARRNSDVTTGRGQEAVQAVQGVGPHRVTMCTRIATVPAATAAPAVVFLVTGSEQAGGEARDTGTHLFLVEQGSVCIPRLMPVSACLRILQA